MTVQKIIQIAFLASATLLAGSRSLTAAGILFDFEDPSELRAWHDEGRTTLGPGKSVEITNGFASSGKYALRFATPKWKTGMPQWPAFECDPPLTNWSEFDRLVLDVTNPGDQPQTLSFFITDSKVATREGLAQTARVPARTFQPITIHLSGLRERGVNPADIRRIHFFTTEPVGDLDLRIDRIRLLHAGEEDASLPLAFLREIGALRLAEAVALKQSLDEATARMTTQVRALPESKAWLSQELTALDTRVALLDQDLRAGADPVLQAEEEITSIKGQMARLDSLLEWRKRFEPLRKKLQHHAAGKDLVIGFATAMEKIAPRTRPVPAQVTNSMELSLARNERESFQVLAWAGAGMVRQVTVKAGDLATTKGRALAATNITTSLMGYVQTTTTPPYGTAYTGWWPDPILDYTNTTDIAAGDVQSFWIRVRVPEDQPPGIYKGRLQVLVEGREAFAFKLSVRVFDFTLPRVSPLPLAVTFSPEENALPETREVQAQWRKSPDYPLNAWKRHRARWAEFLSEYYLTYDSLYHRGQPDFELLQTLAARGKLGRFNLGYYDYVPAEPGGLEAWKARTLPRLREAYARARELGMLPQAYIYGCDEVTEKFFPQVEQAATILKQEFPEALIMTTTYDHSFGTGSVIKSVDAFCPLTPKFDPEKAAAARGQGKQVWWYICCGPHPPHANMFIELPAIEGRILMGAMTAKYRPDGFLYYQISIWNSEHCLTGGPFTNWDPRSWTVYHGDGSWTCVGPDGTPLPTIRLENFRDGLEDYAYVKLLEQEIARVESSGRKESGRREWLTRARACLEVPVGLVQSRTEFSHDPAQVYAFRQKVAETLERGHAFK